MNMSFYSAAAGAAQQQLRLNIQSNNIANVNTYGYKAKKPTFASLMYGDLRGIDGVNLPRGTGARMVLADTDFRGGPLADTGKEYDYAIAGDGFFALYDPSTGELSYTRDGSFTLSGFQRPDENGDLESIFLLSDGEGRLVLDSEGLPIQVTGQENREALPIAVYDFANTNGMLSAGANRFTPIEKNGPPMLVEDAVLEQGLLEASNVDLAHEIVKVIEAQRSFSYALRMVQTSDEIETTINGLRG